MSKEVLSKKFVVIINSGLKFYLFSKMVFELQYEFIFSKHLQTDGRKIITIESYPNVVKYVCLDQGIKVTTQK